MLKNVLSSYAAAGLTAKVYDAPKDAVLFDKMVVVFSTNACKSIKMVTLYDSRINKVIGSY